MARGHSRCEPDNLVRKNKSTKGPLTSLRWITPQVQELSDYVPVATAKAHATEDEAMQMKLLRKRQEEAERRHRIFDVHSPTSLHRFVLSVDANSSRLLASRLFSLSTVSFSLQIFSFHDRLLAMFGQKANVVRYHEVYMPTFRTHTLIKRGQKASVNKRAGGRKRKTGEAPHHRHRQGRPRLAAR